MNAAKGGTGVKRASGTDWREIRGRLEAVREATERGWLPGAGETRRILNARAQALARERGKPEAAGESLEVVEFVLAHERYAVEAQFVREVHPLEDLTPLPCTPAFVLGIVNLRGEVVSVIDIRKFFELPEKGPTDLSQVIVLHGGRMRFGILADAVTGVRQIAVAEIQPSLPTLTGVREKYLKGVTAARSVILDAQKLLADEKIVVQEKVEG